MVQVVSDNLNENFLKKKKKKITDLYCYVMGIRVEPEY